MMHAGAAPHSPLAGQGDSDGWTLYYNEDGHPYYYNEHTGESRWAEQELQEPQQQQQQQQPHGVALFGGYGDEAAKEMYQHPLSPRAAQVGVSPSDLSVNWSSGAEAQPEFVLSAGYHPGQGGLMDSEAVTSSTGSAEPSEDDYPSDWDTDTEDRFQRMLNTDEGQQLLNDEMEKISGVTGYDADEGGDSSTTESEADEESGVRDAEAVDRRSRRRLRRRHNRMTKGPGRAARRRRSSREAEPESGGFFSILNAALSQPLDTITASIPTSYEAVRRGSVWVLDKLSTGVQVIKPILSAMLEASKPTLYALGRRSERFIIAIAAPDLEAGATEPGAAAAAPEPAVEAKGGADAANDAAA